MEKRIVDIYKFNAFTMEIVSTPSGYDVIYSSFNNSKHLIKDASLADAYAYIAGYFYSMVTIFESGV